LYDRNRLRGNNQTNDFYIFQNDVDICCEFGKGSFSLAADGMGGINWFIFMIFILRGVVLSVKI
jgi:hypothetical protein